MRVREGEFAYDIEPIKDSSTMLFKHFKVVIEKIRVEGDQKVYEGTTKTFEDAKALAEREIQKLNSETKYKQAS